MMFDEPIHVTRPFLPAFDEFTERLKEIWASRWLTNNGPIVRRFTAALSRRLGTENLALFSNGTLALQIGLQALNVAGEVITTPFTFVATTHALYWNRTRPVFVDIEPDYYTIDPDQVEAAITPWTTAILAVHVYGHPCRLNALADIARRHHLKLIYDAAHAFGVEVAGRPVSEFGDLSMFSFHATKLLHSLEGGLLVFGEPMVKNTVNYLKNFGFQSEVEVVMPGTNAKMNEIQALMGEMVLAHLPEIITARAAITRRYRENLRDVPGIRLVPPFPEDVTYNFSYVPVEIDAKEYGVGRDELYERLKRYNVFARRYFYPLVCDFSCYRSNPVNNPLIVARRVAERILCLPIYPDLALDDVDRICEMVAACAE
jgi:dTDP-4-amino-4,6-dideoxygalactose transaminase